jgi:hypothetical protein
MRSQRAAAVHYQITRSTINNKFNRKPGRPTVLSLDEDTVIVEHVKKQAEFGFPVTEQDLSFIMKAYLDRQARRVAQFKNNMPGYDWVKYFLKRHPNLTVLQFFQ